MKNEFPYPSQRMPVYGRAVAATSQPLATQAAMAAFAEGGNALDAALAAAITLTVVEPVCNGVGGDAFALLWDGNTLHGWNGSGRSPRALTRGHFGNANAMPTTGWDTVTVPGQVDTWAQLHQRLGKLPFASLFREGIRHAREGYPISPITASVWRQARERYTAFPHWNAAFAPPGLRLQAGEVFRLPELADTLQEIAESGGESFYRGRLAECIIRCARDEGGLLREEDLAAHHGDWVDPVSIPYHGTTAYEIPPNGQGLATLIALGILQRTPIREFPGESVEALHLQVEAMKLAFQVAFAEIADPDHMKITTEDLLSEERLAGLAGQIRLDRALAIPPQAVPGGGTVCLSTADASGMMVSYIQSNYAGFGSGVVVPDTGIALQNRGSGFTLRRGHPNEVGPGKRPFHTIIPGFVFRDGNPLFAFGLMGGHMQAQGHLQMIHRVVDRGENPQTASDAPRWQVEPDFQLALEESFPADMAEALQHRGHRIIPGAPSSAFGGFQGVLRLPNGTYCAASDSRKDGHAAGR